MGVVEEDLHPWQQHRLVALREAIEFIEHGQLPPTPLPCFNSNCLKPTELFEFKDERDLREFVASGLCASCQETMLQVCMEASGPDSPRPTDTRPAGGLPCIWSGTRWRPVCPGMRLRCSTTLFADADRQEQPIWVAGETFTVESLWEVVPDPSTGGVGVAFSPRPNPPLNTNPRGRIGDGLVTCVVTTGRKFSAPIQSFRRRLERGELEPGYASCPYMLMGCVSLEAKIVLSLEGLPDNDWVVTCMLLRVPGLKLNNMILRGGGQDSLKTLAEVCRDCPMAAALVKMMCDDERSRRAGSFERKYAGFSVQRRPNIILTVSKTAAQQQQHHHHHQAPA